MYTGPVQSNPAPIPSSPAGATVGGCPSNVETPNDRRSISTNPGELNRDVHAKVVEYLEPGDIARLAQTSFANHDAARSTAATSKSLDPCSHEVFASEEAARKLTGLSVGEKPDNYMELLEKAQARMQAAHANMKTRSTAKEYLEFHIQCRLRTQPTPDSVDLLMQLGRLDLARKLALSMLKAGSRNIFDKCAYQNRLDEIDFIEKVVSGEDISKIAGDASQDDEIERAARFFFGDNDAVARSWSCPGAAKAAAEYGAKGVIERLDRQLESSVRDHDPGRVLPHFDSAFADLASMWMLRWRNDPELVAHMSRYYLAPQDLARIPVDLTWVPGYQTDIEAVD